MAHPGGRPMKFKSAEELQEKIDAYFDNCDPHKETITEWVTARDKSGKVLLDKNGLSYLVEITHNVMTEQKPYTITGLALALDTSRRTLLDYKYRDDEFSHSLKRAKDKCESYVESRLFENNPTGPIFNLKNNYGWKDKTEVDNTNIHIEADDITDTLDKLSESERTKAYTEIANASASEVLEIVAKYKK